MIWNDYKAEIQEIDLSTFTNQDLKLSILREDLIHPEISGNKFRKLKYNLSIFEAAKIRILFIILSSLTEEQQL